MRESGVALGAPLQGRPGLAADQAHEGGPRGVQARGDELPPVSPVLPQSGVQQRGQVCRISQGNRKMSTQVHSYTSLRLC